MIQIEEGKILLKTTDFKFVRTKEDVITIRLYEVMAGEESSKFIAGPVIPMETRLPKERFHGRGATPDEALQDCIDKIKDVDKDSMFMEPPPMLPPSSMGRF
jgi:hypothetical protein